MTEEAKIALIERVRPFRFDSQKGRLAGIKSGVQRRKVSLKMPLMPNESKKFDERTLVRVRKQLVLCDRLFKIEFKKYKPQPAKLAKLADAQSRLWELERRLCGQPAQPKTTSDPVKSDIPDV